MDEANTDLFGQNWANLIQSLDVGPEKAKGIEKLPDDQKRQLLSTYATKNPKSSAFQYVTLIKGLRAYKIGLPKGSRRGELNNAKSILSATEISLRTNDVSWVYDFLDQNGLDVLLGFMSKTIRLVIRMENPSPPSRSQRNRSSLYKSERRKSLDNHILPNDDEYFNGDSEEGHRQSFWCHGGKANRAHPLSYSPPASENMKEGLHQCVKCFRALLNNQRGCTMTFEHPNAINVIALCFLHPNYQTKTLVLELLAALCLIENGHHRVLSSFDNLKREMGESNRFETLVHYFCTHESRGPDNYNFDFMLTESFALIDGNSVYLQQVVDSS
ncbi:unnamed protein product [Protopolystoma xenopodis]|uniref:GBD/FH3 domain-containing protein n=1 Tax=Protopolystoma xenopodis TaxID=117903 RepID=A0A3S4ZGZ2_9PLAT|nr:unnamed protein product [Protopolystoma xenopodis]